MKNSILFLMMILCFACVDDKLSPESALKTFVESRFDSVVTREFVLERVTGKLQQGLENTSEEEFQKFADMRNMKQESFRILSKSCMEKKCFITYAIAYRSKQDDKATSATEVKKIAELQQVDGKWLIADVSNVKTYVEALEPISPLE